MVNAVSSEGHCEMSMLTAPTQRSKAPLTRRAPEPRPVQRPQTLVNTGTANSHRTGRIFEVLLGAAACLSLVAVVQQATTTPVDAGSPDAPPPAVFVHSD